MYQGKELSYDAFWNLIKNNPDAKWYIMAYGGNYSFLQPSLINYIKVAEILDADENEAGYKQIYFQQFKDQGDKFVESGGFAMDNWNNAEYNIRVHSLYPLEILVDWYDKDDGFRDIILLRDHNEKVNR